MPDIFVAIEKEYCQIDRKSSIFDKWKGSGSRRPINYRSTGFGYGSKALIYTI
jgi:hypothetical protein